MKICDCKKIIIVNFEYEDKLENVLRNNLVWTATVQKIRAKKVENLKLHFVVSPRPLESDIKGLQLLQLGFRGKDILELCSK